VIYLKLSRPSEKAGRQICAVVTAGTVGQLYAGRNGVFYDRDGKDWEAVITRVVESQVSLAEAFWAPWKKLGECVGDMVKKFLGDRQSAATTKVAAGARDAQAGGAAIAGSVAAIGIGVGVMGAAFASIASAVSGMSAGQIALSLVGEETAKNERKSSFERRPEKTDFESMLSSFKSASEEKLAMINRRDKKRR
jgi:hypothetical protein